MNPPVVDAHSLHGVCPAVNRAPPNELRPPAKEHLDEDVDAENPDPVDKQGQARDAAYDDASDFKSVHVSLSEIPDLVLARLNLSGAVPVTGT